VAKGKDPRGYFPSDDEIAMRAYEMFLERLWSDASRRDIWYEAETELLDRAARRLLKEHKADHDPPD
jgi:hypothetical protein